MVRLSFPVAAGVWAALWARSALLSVWEPTTGGPTAAAWAMIAVAVVPLVLGALGGWFARDLRDGAGG